MSDRKREKQGQRKSEREIVRAKDKGTKSKRER